MVRSVAGFKEDPSVFVVGASHVNVTTPPVTVSVAVLVIPPDVAVIVVEPAATDAAKPLDPTALLIVAIPAFDELHVTAAVRSCVELSEYVPMAVNCWVAPNAMLGPVGVTVRDTSVAAVTVSVVDAEILPDVAVIVVEPAATDVARPFEPTALLMAATAPVDELQVTAAVRFCVVLSE